MQWLNEMGIQIFAHIHSIADVSDEPNAIDWTSPDPTMIQKDFPVVNPDAGMNMMQAITNAKKDGDSVGGIIQCFVTGVPAGWGDPMFGGIENRIAQIIYGIPAVKGVAFGNGFASASLRGSNNNDNYTIVDGKIQTVTNNAGGILGGITTGIPIIFSVAIKPTPSIAKSQMSVSLSNSKQKELVISGRHDPCIVPRAVPVVEAAAAIALYDAYLSNHQRSV